MGNNYKIAQIHWQKLKIFFSRTTRPISTKLGTKHPWVREIQDCSNERPGLIVRGDNYETANDSRLKMFFSRTTGPISTKLGTKHPRMRGIQDCSNERPGLIVMGNNYETANYWRLKNHRTIFNQTWHKASLGEGDSRFYVAHGSLVVHVLFAKTIAPDVNID